MLIYLLVQGLLSLTYQIKASHSQITLTFDKPLNAIPATKCYYFYYKNLIYITTTPTLSGNILSLTINNSYSQNFRAYLIFNYPYLVYENGNPTNFLQTGKFYNNFIVNDSFLGLQIFSTAISYSYYTIFLISLILMTIDNNSVTFFIFLSVSQVQALYYSTAIQLFNDAQFLLNLMQPLMLRFTMINVFSQTWWNHMLVAFPLLVFGLFLALIGTRTNFIHNNPTFQFCRFNVPNIIIITCCPVIINVCFVELTGSWSSLTKYLLAAKILSIFLILFYIVYIILCFAFLWQDTYGLDTNLTKQTYGLLYKGLKTDSYISRNLWNIDLLKKFLLAFFVSINAKQMEYFKFVFSCLIESLMILLVLYNQPITDPISNKIYFVIQFAFAVSQCIIMTLMLSSSIITIFLPNLHSLFVIYVVVFAALLNGVLLLILLSYQTFKFIKENRQQLPQQQPLWKQNKYKQTEMLQLSKED